MLSSSLDVIPVSKETESLICTWYYSLKTVDLAPRKLRYFIVVAEELNFGRAAKRLYIAQQSLSSQIRELEDEIGVQLLYRTTRKVELSPAGEVFLQAAIDALATIDNGVEDARRAARGETGKLKVGFNLGAALELTQPILAEFRTRFPGIEVELREFDFSDTSAGLVSSWSDLAFVRAPISAEGIESVELFVEPRVLSVAKDHPLALRSEVRVDEILNLTLAIGKTSDRGWRDFWAMTDYRPEGAQLPLILQTSSQTEENEIVASGAASCVTAACIARYVPHPNIRNVRIADVTGSAVVLAWRAEANTSAAQNFVSVALEVRDREQDLLRAIEHPFTD